MFRSYHYNSVRSTSDAKKIIRFSLKLFAVVPNNHYLSRHVITMHHPLPCRSDEKSACVAICDRMGLKGYQVYKKNYRKLITASTLLICNLNFHKSKKKVFNYFIILQIGKTKVFLRAGQMAELDARRAEILAYAARRIQRQIRTHLTRKEFITLRRATIQMQKHWRGNFPFS